MTRSALVLLFSVKPLPGGRSARRLKGFHDHSPSPVSSLGICGLELPGQLSKRPVHGRPDCTSKIPTLRFMPRTLTLSQTTYPTQHRSSWIQLAHAFEISRMTSTRKFWPNARNRDVETLNQAKLLKFHRFFCKTRF